MNVFKRQEAFHLFLASFSIVLATFAAYRIYVSESWINLAVDSSGLLLGLLAFYIAVRTFFSIDGVAVMSRMEGNLLENEDYTCPLGKLISENDGASLEEISEKLTKRLSDQSKSAKTALKVADFLQDFVDVIVLFPMFKKDDSYFPELKKFIKDTLEETDEKVKEFHNVSGGNSILLTETTKLIREVLAYQGLVDTEVKGRIFSIRGGVFKNPVSKIVYHDYLGLQYYKKAIKVVVDGENLAEASSYDGIKQLYTSSKKKLLIVEDAPKLELAVEYCESAKKEFERSLKQSDSDPMWKGYLSFNLARVKFLLFFLGKEENDFLDSFEQCLKHRNLLVGLVNDLASDRKEGGDNTSMFLKFFSYQYDLASLYFLSLKQILKSDDERFSNIPISEKYKKSVLNLRCTNSGYEKRLDAFTVKLNENESTLKRNE